MKYTLLIDYREKSLKTYFETFDFTNDKHLKNIILKIENLDLGDIIIKKDEKVILIIERKTLQDLYSSINDGRYKEQKVRLKNNYDDHQIVYIIEDSDLKFVRKKFANVDSIINGAILNCMFRDNIKIIRTTNIDETIVYIKTLIKKIKNNIEYFEKMEIDNLLDTNDLRNEDSHNENNIKIIELKTKESSNYVDNIKIKKKENNTPNNCNIVMLCQIPGVSTKVSKIIIEKYNNISNLIMEYNKLDTDKSKEMLLKDMIFSISNDKTRKIGPVVSKRIYEYLFSN
jgi:crossover junction endonuclease MUS81